MRTLFDEDTVARTAADYDIPTSDLADLLARHQAAVDSLPGVENLVYEWRKQFPQVSVERTESAYYVVVPDWVWKEFGDHLDLSDVEREALAAVHRETVMDRLREDGSVNEAFGGPSAGTDRAFVALSRTE